MQSSENALRKCELTFRSYPLITLGRALDAVARVAGISV
jgi:hypothetical protein